MTDLKHNELYPVIVITAVRYTVLCGNEDSFPPD